MVKSRMARQHKQINEPSLLAGEQQIPDTEATEIIGRLKRVEGQVRAIQRLISEGRDCHLIAQQLAAARVALSRASVQLMASRMVECIRNDAGEASEVEVKRLTSTFMKVLA